MFNIKSKLLIILSIIFTNQAYCTDVGTNCTALQAFTNYNIYPVDFTGKLVTASKTCIPSASTFMCGLLRHPYKLLLQSEAVGLTYVICMKSCEHSTPLLKAIMSPLSSKKLLLDSGKVALDAASYSLGEVTYNNIKDVQTRKLIGNGSIVIVFANLLCQQCCDTYLPEAGSCLLSGLAISRGLEMLKDYSAKTTDPTKKESRFMSLIKNPIVIGTVALGGLAISAYCADIKNTNLNEIIPNVASTIQQSVIYAYGLRLSKTICAAFYNKAGSLLQRFKRN